MTRSLPFALSLVALLACSSEPRPDETDDDTDAATTTDAGTTLDAGPVDAGTEVPVDAGPEFVDAGPEPVDAGPEPVDAGPEPVDAGPAPVDAGTPDAGPVVTIRDPNLAGPFTVAKLTGTQSVGSVQVGMRAAYPTGLVAGVKAPVVVFGHGFQLPISQYEGYLTHLASHGFIGVGVEYPDSLFGPDHTKSANELLAGLDWVKTRAELASFADTDRAGASGHSLGGKLAVMAASKDARLKAVFVLDPVDGGSFLCPASACPDASNLLPLAIPTGFVGETLDASGGLQPCAPAADNFLTFYTRASSPSLAVTVAGANHMSFLDDVSSCGFTCSACKAPSAANADVNALAKAWMAAFYLRHLQGLTGYDTYLTGAEAQARYVTPGKVTLVSK